LPRVSGFLEIHKPGTTGAPEIETSPPPRVVESNARRFLLRLKQRSLSVWKARLFFVSAVIGVGSLPVVFLALFLFAR
jgi:hypothetical protein